MFLNFYFCQILVISKVLVSKISFCQADLEFTIVQQFTDKSDRTPTLSNLLPVDHLNIRLLRKRTRIYNRSYFIAPSSQQLYIVKQVTCFF